MRTHSLCFGAKIRKIIYPCRPDFHYIKVGFKAYSKHGLVILMLPILQVDVVPLTSCFHLHILNLADNHITTLNNTVDILGQLRRLEVLSLHVSFKLQ